MQVIKIRRIYKQGDSAHLPKARVTSVAISVSPNSDESGKQSLYPDGDPDRHQNLTICLLAHCQPSLKISCKSVRKFLREVAKRQTDRQTNNKENITSLAEAITSLVD